MNIIRNKTVLGLIAGFLVGIALVYGAVYWLSLKKLTVTYKNASNVLVYKTSALDSGKTPKPAAKITYSGQTIKLVKGSYTFKYDGNEGYESLYKEVAVIENENFVSIKPSYTEQKLTDLLSSEAALIKAEIIKQYPRAGLYQINQGKLFGDGDWYGTKLIYKSDDIFNNDTLRIVLHKEEGKWVIMTNPPDISLSKYIYPDVPKNILDKVNEMD